MVKRYVVRLEADEREQLDKLVSAGKAAAKKLTRARILLKADQSQGSPAWTDQQIAEALDVAVRTVEYVRQRLVEQGLESALERKRQARSSTPLLLEGGKAARLVAVCCSQPPKGRKRWTLQLLADRLVELKVVDSVSYETVRRTLKKTS